MAGGFLIEQTEMFYSSPAIRAGRSPSLIEPSLSGPALRSLFLRLRAKSFDRRQSLANQLVDVGPHLPHCQYVLSHPPSRPF